jgi:uncharacterized coiled-coil protein SlyX
MWKNKDQEASGLDKDLQEQTMKLERAQKQLYKMTKEIKGISSQTQPIPLLMVRLLFTS